MPAQPTTHLLGTQVDLRDLLRLRGDAARFRRRARSTGAPGGSRRTRRHGRGLEFEEVRAYAPTDDARNIDWRVTARKGRPHTRVFREEREQPVLFGLDLRAPMAFGTRGRFKRVAAAELFALHAWAALADEDRVGAVIATPDGLLSFAPRRSESTVLQMLAAVAQATQRALPATAVPAGVHPVPPSLDAMLAALDHGARAGHRCMVISDFHDLTPAGTQRLRALARLGETACVLVFDPLEAELPPPGRYTLRSADGGPPLRLDTTDPELRARHRAAFAARRATLASLARQAGVSAHELPVDAHAAPLGVGISAGSGAGSDGIRPATARPS
jgi:uncharacterized protein (DUF58 family)